MVKVVKVTGLVIVVNEVKVTCLVAVVHEVKIGCSGQSGKNDGFGDCGPFGDGFCGSGQSGESDEWW